MAWGFSGGNDDADAFDDIGEGVDRPMWRIFTGYGGEFVPEFVVGAVASVLARFLELVPALILARAIDSLFVGDQPFRPPRFRPQPACRGTGRERTHCVPLSRDSKSKRMNDTSIHGTVKRTSS